MYPKLRTICLASFLVSCGIQDNESSFKQFKDIKRAEKRSDGLYNVVCMDGSVEIGISLEAITGDRVCNSSPSTPEEPLPLYTKAELEATKEVFSELGELLIDPANIGDSPNDNSRKVTYSAQEGGIPWAAYWYPKRGRDMFDGENAPLQKIDLWLNSQGGSSNAVQWESDHYDSAAAEWEGLCDAWAMASVLTLEPKSEVTIDGIKFAPADLKAVAIKYYEGYKPKVYGRRYQGLAATDGQMQDLRPEAFHRIIEEFIGRQKRPVVIDEDPGSEVWSKPVFRYVFNIYRDPQHAHALLVRAFPWMIRPRAEVDGSLTSLVTDLSAPIFEYRLYHDAKPATDGKLRIIAGEWLNSSKYFHPDMVFLPKDMENRDQPNSEIRNNAEAIRGLLEKAGMLRP